MITKAELNHIEMLHRIGRQLLILKKVYESYRLLIDRLIKRQKEMDRLKKEVSGSKEHQTEVVLGSAAVTRLVAMRDRISLYALGEIDDCYNEKEALVLMVRRMTFLLHPFRAYFSTDFQFDQSQGITSGRAIDSHHDLPCKDYDPIFTRHTYDRLLFDPNSRLAGKVYSDNILGLLRHCYWIVFYLFVGVWILKWHS